MGRRFEGRLAAAASQAPPAMQTPHAAEAIHREGPSRREGLSRRVGATGPHGSDQRLRICAELFPTARQLAAG